MKKLIKNKYFVEVEFMETIVLKTSLSEEEFKKNLKEARQHSKETVDDAPEYDIEYGRDIYNHATHTTYVYNFRNGGSRIRYIHYEVKEGYTFNSRKI